MRDSLRLGHIAGVPIGINWSILAVAAYLVVTLTFGALPRWFPSASLSSRLLVSSGATALFFVSILGHELGHAIAARRHGIEVDGITLWLLGGLARLKAQAPTPRAELEVAAAGPGASFLIAGAFAGSAIALDATTDFRLAAAGLSWLAITNILLGGSNLLPAAPLDGGRVLSALLWYRWGEAERARLFSARVGLVVGGLAVIGFVAAQFAIDEFAIWWVVLGVGTGAFVAQAAIGEIRGSVIRRRLDDTTTASIMHRHPPAHPDSMSAAAFLDWARTHPTGPACAVVRWDDQPIGYVAPGSIEALGAAERSWTTLGQVMTPVATVARAWETETVATLLGRLDDAQTEVVVHDPASGTVTGTLTRAHLDPLFARPDAWGRSRPPDPTEADRLVPV